MKILQVIPYFVPAWDYGGPLLVCYQLSKELVKRGHEVVVYTTDTLNAKNRTAEGKEIISGITVRRFSNISNTLAYRHKIYLSPGMAMAVRKELSGFDIIHMHEYRTIQNAVIHHYAWKYGIPFIVQAHGSVLRIMKKTTLKWLYDKIWGYRLLRDATKVIALTKTEAGQYQSIGVSENKVEIVPNGIDLTEFKSLPPRGEFRRRYGLDGSQEIILYLGRIHQTKGIDLLAKGFAELPGNLNRAKLVIVGPDDGYRSALEALVKELGIEEKVLFTGPLYGKEKLEAYVDADVFVTPSFNGFPMTFLEACACGVPIVTTQAGDRLDWVHNQVGLVVPFDKGQLTGALQRMLTDEDVRQKFGRRGKALVQEQFNWQKIAGKFEEIYRKAIEVK